MLTTILGDADLKLPQQVKLNGGFWTKKIDAVGTGTHFFTCMTMK